MIADLFIGIVSSVLSNIIVSFFSDKWFGKSKDVLSSIYTIYIGFSSFVFILLFTFLMSDNIQKSFSTWAGTSVFTLIRYISSLFWILFINVTIVTIIFIVVRQIGLTHKASNKNYHDFMETLHETETRDNK